MIGITNIKPIITHIYAHTLDGNVYDILVMCVSLCYNVKTSHWGSYEDELLEASVITTHEDVTSRGRII